MRFPAYLLLLFVFLSSCSPKDKTKNDQASPAGYNFNDNEKVNLPEELDEISGLVFDSGMIVALNDEEGVLYRFGFKHPNQYADYRFHKGADFEELVSVSPSWYALKSNGTIYKIDAVFTENPRTRSFPFPEKGQHEFEAMLYDSTSGHMLIFCKICRKTPAADPEVFAFNVKTETWDSSAKFRITVTPDQQKQLGKKHGLQISAAAVHPFTGDWYFMASASGVFIITDNSGKCKQLVELSKKKFKQPEGICFAPNGDMYVSNEARTGMGNIYLSRYAQ